MISIRNPYPVPDVSREGIWTKEGPFLGQNVSSDDAKWYTKLKPHERLFAHHTLNSIRRDYKLLRLQEPRDSLDLALSSVYNHSIETGSPKWRFFTQPETMGEETWRVLRNQIKIQTKSQQFLNHGLRHAILYGKENVTEKVRRIHPNSVDLAIEGYHADKTNPGYSRKIDGTFYGI